MGNKTKHATRKPFSEREGEERRDWERTRQPDRYTPEPRAALESKWLALPDPSFLPSTQQMLVK
jgi:hypothetical protein